MSKSEHVTTARHFAIFKAECKRLLKLWGVNDWDVTFAHEGLSYARAQCRFSLITRVATISLGRVWSGDGNKAYEPAFSMIKDCARHECAHLLLAPLHGLTGARYVTEDEEKCAVESVCRHLQGLLP